MKQLIIQVNVESWGHTKLAQIFSPQFGVICHSSVVFFSGGGHAASVISLLAPARTEIWSQCWFLQDLVLWSFQKLTSKLGATLLTGWCFASFSAYAHTSVILCVSLSAILDCSIHTCMLQSGYDYNSERSLWTQMKLGRYWRTHSHAACSWVWFLKSPVWS